MIKIYAVLLSIMIIYYIVIEMQYKKEKKYDKILFNSYNSKVTEFITSLNEKDKLLIRYFMDDLKDKYNPKRKERGKFQKVLLSSIITLTVSAILSSIDSYNQKSNLHYIISPMLIYIISNQL